MSLNAHRWAMALLLLVAACSSSDAVEPASTTEPTVAASTTLATAVPTTPVSTTTSTAPAPTAPTSTVPAAPTSTVTVAPVETSAPGPLDFIDGRFLGITQGTLMTDAAAALSATPVSLADVDPSVPMFACTGTSDPSVIQSGGLTLVFESWEGTPAVLTNWQYVGGPVGRFTEMVAARDIRIGDTRDQVVAAYPDFMDLGDEIAVFDPILRFAFEGDLVAWFGIIDCAFESSEPTD